MLKELPRGTKQLSTLGHSTMYFQVSKDFIGENCSPIHIDHVVLEKRSQTPRARQQDVGTRLASCLLAGETATSTSFLQK